MTSNPTHRKRLARSLSEACALPYKQALRLVNETADARELPGRLDAAGMAAALDYLQQRVGGPADTYEVFVERAGGEPTARQCERWAAAAPTGQAAQALTRAGWLRCQAGSWQAALDLFRTAQADADEELVLTIWAGQAETLYRLGAKDESLAVLLRLADTIAGDDPDGQVQMEVCDILAALDDPQFDLQWCDRLLAGTSDPLSEAMETVLAHRQEARERLGLEPDELDHVALAREEDEAELEAELSEALNQLFQD